MRKLAFVVGPMLALVGVVGCTRTQKGAAIDTATGALAGAVIGHQSGHKEGGALIGAAVGAAAGAAIGHQTGKKMVCPDCGKAYQETAKFCPDCGTKLVYKDGVVEPEPVLVPEVKDKKRKKKHGTKKYWR